MSSARRLRWTPVKDAQNRNSAVVERVDYSFEDVMLSNLPMKSLSPTACMLFWVTSSKPISLASNCLLISNGFPARAPLPNGSTLTLERNCVNLSTSVLKYQAWLQLIPSFVIKFKN